MEANSNTTPAGVENKDLLTKDSEKSGNSRNSGIKIQASKSVLDTNRSSPRHVHFPERKLTIN